jgi:hypothetical protein
VDRRGSLGVVTSLLSELGVNIGKASVFSTLDDQYGVDSFTVDRMNDSIAEELRSRLAEALSSPWASEAVPDWSGLSLGTASASLGERPMDPSPPQMAPNICCSALNGLNEHEASTLKQFQGQFSNLVMRRWIGEGSSSQVWEGDWVCAAKHAYAYGCRRPSHCMPNRTPHPAPRSCPTGGRSCRRESVA